MELAGVVLAAGKGRRMQSKYPKGLHRVCGKALVRYPVELLRQAGAQRVVVVVSPGHRAAIEQELGDAVEYAVQPQPQGTADALAAAAGLLQGQAARLLVCGGDTPLVSAESVRRLLAAGDGAPMALLAGEPLWPLDLGRVIESGAGIERIIEAAEDADGAGAQARQNAGVYAFDAEWLWAALPQVGFSSSGERYLTDLAEIAARQGTPAAAAALQDPEELFGVNDRQQLAAAEFAMRERIRRHWMQHGVTLSDPGSVYIDADAVIGQDTVVRPNTSILGRSVIGEDCEIGPNSIIRDSSVGQGCRVTASMLEEAILGDGSDIGPFSHLRPGAHIEAGVHLGNFVEVKESRIASGSAMGHFGYVGDAEVGPGVNLGAGVITCNYDGKDKHRTIIEAGAFIGCDTMLVAPVSVGAGAITGAGAVITRDVPAARLAVGVPATIRDARRQPAT